MKAIFNGTIRIYQVLVPVKAYAILEDSSPKLEVLHRACRAPVERGGYVCSSCRNEVPPAETVKGTAYHNQYVLLEDDELDQVKLKIESEHRVLEVEQFVRPAEIDPMWIDATYYLLPMAISVLLPYAILSNALRLEKACAVTQYQSHGRHHLGIIRWTEPSLMLHTLHFAQDLRQLDEQTGTDAITLTREQTGLGRALVQRHLKKFAYAQYRDTTEDALWDLIKRNSEKMKMLGPPVIPENSPATVTLVKTFKDSLKMVRNGQLPRPSPLRKKKEGKTKRT